MFGMRGLPLQLSYRLTVSVSDKAAAATLKKRDLFARILKEKKRYTAVVVETVKKRVMRTLGRG
jgi:hypothetical protein